MKKSTGLVFLAAAALAVFVYFSEFRHKPSAETPADASKPVFSVASTDIKQIEVERSGTMADFERRNDGWYMTRPLATRAEQSVVNAIESQLSSVRVDRTFPSTPENIAAFALNQPVVTISFTTNSGAKHTLKLGGKDFSGSSIYALVDDGKNVALLSDSILSSSDKSVDDFRDHDLLQVTATDASSFDLVNPSGQMAASKQGDNWKIQKPRQAAADDNAVISFLGSINSGRVSQFVAGKAGDPSKYGLDKPAIVFRVKLPEGKSAELQVGRKEGDEYYARDVSRPAVFRISGNVYKVLSQSFFDLRDKQLIHFFESDVKRAEVRNPNGAITCLRGANGDFVVEQPADKKGTPASCLSFLSGLQLLRSVQIYDAAPAKIQAELAKPVVQVSVTENSGRETKIEASGIAGDAVYARTSASSAIYKLEKQAFDALNFKPAAVTSPPAP
jgi:hypothetical protein